MPLHNERSATEVRQRCLRNGIVVSDDIRADSKELFFVNPEGKVMAVPVTTSTGPKTMNKN
jgi:hypothetical protein